MEATMRLEVRIDALAFNTKYQYIELHNITCIRYILSNNKMGPFHIGYTISWLKIILTLICILIIQSGHNLA